MRCVAMEVCDVTILPLRVAKYYVNSKFPDSLIITGELFDSIPIGADLEQRCRGDLPVAQPHHIGEGIEDKGPAEQIAVPALVSIHQDGVDGISSAGMG